MADDRPTVRELLLARLGDDRLGLEHDERSWTWDEYVTACVHRANWLLAQRPAGVPFHVGLLAGNTAEHAMWLGACAIAGAVAVGLNPTRTDRELRRDIVHAEAAIVLVGPELDGRDIAAQRVEFMGQLPVAGFGASVPDVHVGPSDLCMLIFTSGTTSDPKAVQCSHGRLAHSASMVGLMNGLTQDDRVLVSMPLFHSNAVIAGWLAAVSVGAACRIRDFSASGFVEDLRSRGITYANYVGKALTYVVAVPAESGDRDLPLRSVFGNEASEATIHAFAERFGCKVTDAYGSTEGGISLLRTDQTPPGSLGVAIGDVRVISEAGEECPRLALDDDGAEMNLEEAIGELVNFDGQGGFEGYWNNGEANAVRVREGRFHSGDLAWRDQDGFFWFAGRTGEWLRIDGENLAVAPIERVLVEHPDVVDVVVVAVPDPDAGDQILACVEVGNPQDFDINGFAHWCARRDDLSAKALPRFVHAEASLPRSQTNKVLRAAVRQRGLALDGPIWWRAERATAFTPWGT